MSDTDSKFSIADSRFQLGTAGYYQVNANTIFNSFTTDYFGKVNVYKNGHFLIKIRGRSSNDSSYIYVSGNSLVYLSITVYIELYTLSNIEIKNSQRIFCHIYMQLKNITMSIHALPYTSSICTPSLPSNSLS